MKALRVLAIMVIIAFLLLLAVGFDNVLAVLRYRMALLLAMGPLVLLFLWCAWKALPSPRPEDKSVLRPDRDAKK